MHWWQGAFSSASSSKSQSAEDDSVITLKPSGFFSSRRSRQIARARKLRENDASDSWRSSGSHASSSARSASYAASTSAPQPLPLPELHVLLHRDVARVSASSVPLPSPDTVMNDVVDGLTGLQRLVGQDTPKNTEHCETWSSRKSTQTNNLKENHSDNHNFSIPSSCPTSPYASPVLSPRRHEIWAASQYLPPPGIFQVWSAPEMPHSDARLGLGFNYYNPSERIASSVDNSPLQSPRIFGTSPQKITSPLNNRISADKPLSGWESNAGHPLPLPPGAVSSSQATPISQVGSNLDSPGVSMPMQSTPCSSVPVKPEYTGANNVPSQSSSISPMGSKPEVVPRKSQWQKGKLIGRGTFGSVYVASNRETGALCAMKEVEILPDDSKSAESIRQLEQEIKVLSHLKHPNIVQYYGSEIIGDKFYIYLEYVHPGSINKFIHDHCGAITESVVRNFTRHILCGLAYLHSKKTIHSCHRDIKGANLLVDAYGVVKLADFGMAKHLTGQAAYLSLKGSPYWMAPELLQSSMQSDANSDIALAVDIWSLGCTIIEMMNGKPPWSEYEGAAALFKALKESPPIPESLSAEGKDFLNLCFRRNPADRPTAKKLLEHPFVSSHSQQSDPFNQPLKETRSTDNMQFQRDRSTHRTDQGPFSFESHIKRGKLSSTEANQRSHAQTSSIVVPSPCSMLEAIPTLSPSLVVPIQVSPDPPFNFRSSIK